MSQRCCDGVTKLFMKCCEAIMELSQRCVCVCYAGVRKAEAVTKARVRFATVL